MNSKSKIFLGGIQLVLAILMIFFAVYLYSNLSTGWFSENKVVSATGMSTKAKGPRIEKVEITQVQMKRTRTDKTVDTILDMSGNNVDWTQTDCLLPGDTITVKAEITTAASETDIPVELSLKTPADQPARTSEVPVFMGNKYYYLSSQIRLDQAVSTVPSQTEWFSRPVMLSNIAFGSDTVINYGTNCPDILLGKAVLQGSKTYALTLTFRFPNSTTVDQSPVRGDHTKTTAAEVIPSSFWREINVMETA